MRYVIALCVLAAAIINLGPASGQSKPVVLITADEASLGPAPDSDLSFRAGISRGPSIKVLSPKSSDSNLHAPIRLQLKFEGRGGVQIDPDSLKLTYQKAPAVDLTGRIKPYVTETGIDVPEASVPPGTHTLRAEIKDKEGRAGSLTFTLKIKN